MYMKFMTLGQLDDAVDRKAPIYLKRVFGKKKVLLTNYIRGQSCVLSWEINRIRILGKKAGIVAEVSLPEPVISAFEIIEEDTDI